MKKKNGFTLVELLAVIVVLGAVLGVAIYSSTGAFSNAKKKSEKVFVKTLEDSFSMYIDSSDVKKYKLKSAVKCTLNKKTGTAKVYELNHVFKFSTDIFTSEFAPITASDLINPANKETTCNKDAVIHIYRDEDMVYYYEIKKSDLGCLLDYKADDKNDCRITNLPSACLTSCS